jgi:hypothetical protein
VQTVVGAANEASRNVPTVAASTEELGQSSTEINGYATMRRILSKSGICSPFEMVPTRGFEPRTY